MEGVVIWEIFSFGQMPYPGMNNMEAIDRVLNGYRMSSPNNCPQSLASIMKRCWNEKAENRPSFLDMLKELKITTTADSLDVDAMGELLADYGLTNTNSTNVIAYE